MVSQLLPCPNYSTEVVHDQNWYALFPSCTYMLKLSFQIQIQQILFQSMVVPVLLLPLFIQYFRARVLSQGLGKPSFLQSEQINYIQLLQCTTLYSTFSPEAFLISSQRAKHYVLKEQGRVNHPVNWVLALWLVQHWKG